MPLRLQRICCASARPALFPYDVPIDLALFDARDRALPGREMAALNELCRQIVELVRRPPLAERLLVNPTDNVIALRRGWSLK
jgi:hypothetical protein